MLYDQDFDVSAWAKLYNIKLFDYVKYPKGRLFEDSATTYKLIDKSNKIVVNSESKYIYIIRKSSITTNCFSEKKMDMIISTREMCEYIKNKYPELENACNRRLMYAYLSTYTQLVKSKKKFFKIEKELLEYIRNNSKSVLKDKEIPKRDRIALIVLKFVPSFYKFIWKFYEKVTGRK